MQRQLRLRRGVVGAAIVHEAEAHAANSLQERLTRHPRQLPAQVPNVDIHDVAPGVEVHVPHLLEERGTVDHFPGVEHEVFEELEFLGREIQPPIANRGHMPQSIERYGAVSKHLQPLLAELISR